MMMKKKNIYQNLEPAFLRMVLDEYETLKHRRTSRHEALLHLARKYLVTDRTIERWLSKAKNLAEKDKLVEPHRQQLLKTLELIVGMHIDSLTSGEIYDGYVFNIDSQAFDKQRLEYGKSTERLLSHLKTEFPDIFQEITTMTDMLKAKLPTGALKTLMMVKDRGSIQGTCDICKDWYTKGLS